MTSDLFEWKGNGDVEESGKRNVAVTEASVRKRFLPQGRRVFAHHHAIDVATLAREGNCTIRVDVCK